MIISKLEKKENFTNNENEIADYILKHLDEVHLLSAESLAKKAFVSKATVVRFCRKLGVKGYRDFQRSLDKEVEEMMKIKGLLSEEPVNSETKYDEIISIIPSLYERVIGDYVISTEKGEKDMALIISLSGNNPYMIRIAEYLKKRNVFVVGIGNRSSEEIKKACSEYIEIHAPNYILSFEMVSVFTGVNYVLDIFFTSLLVSNYYKNIDTSLEVSKNYEKIEPKVSKK